MWTFIATDEIKMFMGESLFVTDKLFLHRVRLTKRNMLEWKR